MVEAKITLASGSGEHRQFVAQSGSSHAVVIDDKLGNTGAKPIELVLMALGGCTAFDVISILRKKRQTVTSYQVYLTAEQKEDPPTVFTEIKVRHVIAGSNISAKAVRDAIHLSDTKYCAVGAMISKTASIQASYEIRDEQGEVVTQAELSGTLGNL
jgi:putative redox protein